MWFNMTWHTEMAYRDLACSRGPAARDREMDAVLLHVLNHCARAADRIKNGNEAVKGGSDAVKGSHPGVEAPRDQGFTRAKVPPISPHKSKTNLTSAAFYQVDTCY